jgi:hypothetical protein
MSDDTGYIDLGAGDALDEEMSTDPREIVQDSFDYAQAHIPGWQPSEGNLEVVIMEDNAQEAAVARRLAQRKGEADFRALGKLIGVPSIEATPAYGDSTWTLADDEGHIIRAGTQVTLTALDGQPIGFRVVEDLEVPNGETATAAGAVRLVALEDGVRGSGLSGTADLIDAIAWVEVDGIEIDGLTTGGIDAETQAAYLDRLARRLRLMSARVIVPGDAEALVLDVPGVTYAWAIDNYNADTEETDVERCLTVVVVGAVGEELPTEIMVAAKALLEAYRETNFLMFVIAPTYVEIDVDYEVVPAAGYETAAVEAATAAAVSNYLSPLAAILRRQTTIYINELISLLDQIPGVDRVVSVEIAATGGSVAASDLTLTGVAPLSRPGVITPTVTTP